jgi:ectoine hydroxylase-related dioxygenase (phytanoyl-CoA dioxygenase family)
MVYIMAKQIPFIILKIDNHFELKNKILNSIDGMEENKLNNIFKTDWNKDINYPRPYYELVKNLFDNVAENITKIFHYTEKLMVKNYWFQQYKEDNSHSWHVHAGCLFSCVYYVETSNEAPKTTFKLFDDEFDIDVKEGEVLIFPSFLLHCSKPNNSNYRKTVIAFNLT